MRDRAAQPGRIAMLVQSYYLRDPRVRRAAEALSAAGHSVDVFCLRDADRGEGHVETVNGVRIIRLPLARRRGSKLRYIGEYLAFFGMACAAVSAFHLVRRYSLVHIHNLPDALAFAAVLPKLAGARVLLDLHDPTPETLMSKYELSPGHPLVRAAFVLERLAIRFADYAVTVHEPLRDVFIQRGAPSERLGVVMNLADPTGFPRRSRLPDAQRGRFVVLYTGTVSARYGLDLAIEAVSELRDQIPGLVLRIVGEGDQLPELEVMIRERQLESHVELIPPVPYDQVRSLFDDADIGISPHRPDGLFKYSLSNKVYEYTAVGLPVVVPRTECLQTYYPEGTVRFFTPGDARDLAGAILDLFRSPEERWARIQAGWRLTDGWNWSQERRRLLHIVRSLTGTSAAVVESMA